MKNYSETIDTSIKVAKDVYALDCQMIKADIDDTGTLLQNVIGQASAKAEVEEAIRNRLVNLQTGEEVLQHTMEFVNFKNNPDPIGVRVIEGWALSDSPLSVKH